MAKELFAAAVLYLASGEESLVDRLEHAYRLHIAHAVPLLHEIPSTIAEKVHDLERGIREATYPVRQAEKVCQVAYELLLVSLLGMGD